MNIKHFYKHHTNLHCGERASVQDQGLFRAEVGNAKQQHDKRETPSNARIHQAKARQHPAMLIT